MRDDRKVSQQGRSQEAGTTKLTVAVPSDWEELLCNIVKAA